jgi:hypothetical protein
LLKEQGVKGIWAGRLRAIATGEEVPAWPLLQEVARTCGIADSSEVLLDWREQYRSKAQTECASLLGVEIRLLIAEVALTARAFSEGLAFSYSVLVRRLQQLSRDDSVQWHQVEEIMSHAGLLPNDRRWQEIRALWSTTSDRRKNPQRGWRGQ